MADRFWVGGSGTWDTSSTTNWSATSGGSNGASVPTAVDSVFFDQAGTYSVSLGVGITCLDLTVSAGTVTFPFNGPTLAVSGNFSIISGTVWASAGLVTFASTSGTKTILTNGVTLTTGVNFNGVGGTWQLLNALTVSTPPGGGVSLANGTFDLNGYTCTTTGFNSSGSSARTIAFGSGNITLTGSSTAWNTGTVTNFARTGTPTVNVSNNSATATTIVTGTLAESQALNFNYTIGTYTLTDSSSVYRNLNLTGFAGTFANNSRTYFGGFNAGSTATMTAGGLTQTFSATSSTWDITTNGRTCDFPFTFSGTGGTWRLQDSFTSGSARTTTLTSGTLNLNGFTHTVGRFSSSGFGVRAIAFGVGNITLISTGTVWTTSTATNFSRTGTPTVNVSNNTATATTVTTGTLTEAQALDFNYTVGTYVLSDSTAVYRTVSLTGFAGTFGNNARTYFGGFNAGSTATLTGGPSVQTFSATSGVWDITTNGRLCNFPFTFNGAGGTWRLQDSLTTLSVRTTILIAGTLDLNGYTHTTGVFSSSNSTARTIAFGTGNITVIAAGVVWNTDIATNFTRTGTPTVNVSNNNSTATTVSTGALTESQALDFNYTTGTYILTDNAAVYRSLNLTGFSGTFANNARTYFGGFNAGSTATLTSGANTQTFSATSGTWNITRNGRTLNFPFTLNGIGATWRLQDNFTVDLSRAFTLTNGTLDINSQTTSVGSFTLPASTSRAIANGTLTCASVTHTDGAFDIGSTYNISTTGTYTLTAGTLTINDGATLPVGAFSSSNSNVRTIAFGTGQITLSRNNATIWTNQTAFNFSFTGTFKVVATYTGGVGTRTLLQGGLVEALIQSISTTGSSGFILDTSSGDIKVLSGVWNNFDMTGVMGTLSNTGRGIYGNFNAGSTVTLTAGGNGTSFSATSGTKTITSNGRTLNFPLVFNGVGGTWQLTDSLTVGASHAFTLSNGTFNANNYNVTIGTLSSSNFFVRTLALGSGTWIVAGIGALAWTFVTSTNATITGTATISMTGASAKTFAGGGLTWPTLNQGGSGDLTISGNNTFTDITSTYTTGGACGITFTAGSTQSVSNFTASGTVSGQLTLSSTSLSQYNLVKLGGGDVNVSFCTISYSNASP